MTTTAAPQPASSSPVLLDGALEVPGAVTDGDALIGGPLRVSVGQARHAPRQDGKQDVIDFRPTSGHGNLSAFGLRPSGGTVTTLHEKGLVLGAVVGFTPTFLDGVFAQSTSSTQTTARVGATDVTAFALRYERRPGQRLRTVIWGASDGTVHDTEGRLIPSVELPYPGGTATVYISDTHDQLALRYSGGGVAGRPSQMKGLPLTAACHSRGREKEVCDLAAVLPRGSRDVEVAAGPHLVPAQPTATSPLPDGRVVVLATGGADRELGSEDRAFMTVSWTDSSGLRHSVAPEK